MYMYTSVLPPHSPHQNMHFRQCLLLVGGFKRFLVFALLTFLVCGEKEEPSVIVGQSYQPHNVPEKLHQHQQQHKLPRYPFGVYFSEKRKVPNASDPLHNHSIELNVQNEVNMDLNAYPDTTILCEARLVA